MNTILTKYIKSLKDWAAGNKLKLALATFVALGGAAALDAVYPGNPVSAAMTEAWTAPALTISPTTVQ